MDSKFLLVLVAVAALVDVEANGKISQSVIFNSRFLSQEPPLTILLGKFLPFFLDYTLYPWYNGYKLNSLLAVTFFPRGFIAQLVEHCIGIAEVMG